MILKKNKIGVTSIELLVSIVILIIVMTGVNAVLITKFKLNNYEKDLLEANNLSQKFISEISKSILTTEDFILLSDKTENLSNFKFKFLSEDEKNNLKKYVYKIVTKNDIAFTTKDTNKGNNIVIFIDKKPSQIGINIGKSAMIYNMYNKSKEIVYIKNYNDNSKSIFIEDTSPEKGRSGLKNSYPIGSPVIVNDKFIKLYIYYADKNNINAISSTDNKPLCSFSSIIPIPIGVNEQ